MVGSIPLILCGASVIVLNERNEVLLQHRTDTLSWGIPGGLMEPGESLEETARRELYEEAGISIGKLVLYDVFSGQDMFCVLPNGDQIYNVSAVYICKDIVGELKIDTSETLEAKYYAFAGLPPNILSHHRMVLDKLSLDQRLFTKL